MGVLLSIRRQFSSITFQNFIFLSIFANSIFQTFRSTLLYTNCKTAVDGECDVSLANRSEECDICNVSRALDENSLRNFSIITS